MLRDMNGEPEGGPVGPEVQEGIVALIERKCREARQARAEIIAKIARGPGPGDYCIYPLVRGIEGAMKGAG